MAMSEKEAKKAVEIITNNMKKISEESLHIICDMILEYLRERKTRIPDGVYRMGFFYLMTVSTQNGDVHYTLLKGFADDEYVPLVDNADELAHEMVHMHKSVSEDANFEMHAGVIAEMWAFAECAMTSRMHRYTADNLDALFPLIREKGCRSVPCGLTPSQVKQMLDAEELNIHKQGDISIEEGDNA